MRVLLALFVCVAILGGVWLFTQQRGNAASVTAVAPANVTADLIQGLTLELHATAPLAGSAFATEPQAPALTVLLHGAPLAAVSELPAFEIRALDLPALPRAQVELLATASLVPPNPQHPQALRLRVLRHGVALVDTTAWSLPSHPGLPLTIPLPLDLRHLPDTAHAQ